MKNLDIGIFCLVLILFFFVGLLIKVTAGPSGQINVIKNGTTNITYFDGRAMYTFEDRDHLFMTVSDGGVIHHPACKCQNK